VASIATSATSSGFKGRRQRRVALGLVVEPLDIDLGAQHRDINMRLGHVDAHHH
jgi:hypothetical protein